MKQKPPHYLGIRLVFYIVWLAIMTVGVALSVKSDFGVSPISSIPYTMTCVAGIELGKQPSSNTLFPDGRNRIAIKTDLNRNRRSVLFYRFLLFKVSAASPAAIPAANTPPQMAHP